MDQLLRKLDGIPDIRDDEHLKAALSLAQAGVLLARGDVAQAEEQATVAMQMYQRMRHMERYLAARNLLGNIALEQNKFALAERHYLATRQLFKQHTDNPRFAQWRAVPDGNLVLQRDLQKLLQTVLRP
jgi:hypothetical protein